MSGLTLDQHRAEFERIEEQRRALRRAHRVAETEAARDRALNALIQETDPTSDLLTVLGAFESGAMGAYWHEDERLYRQAKVHADALKEAARARQQAKANARQAQAVRAAACGCGMVHAGECY